MQLSNTKVRDLMVPRAEIEAIEVDEPVSVLHERFVESGMSKLLVYRKSIDDVIGYVHGYELFRHPRNIRSVMRPVNFMPGTMPADEVLQLFIKQRTHVAVVVDEFGGTAGMLTIEDLVERIVGEITPAYSLLPAHRLAHMAQLRADVRFVYLMRDPVDRLWSHVRMIAERRSESDEAAAELARLILDRVLAGGEDHIAIRGDYRAALEKLAEAVAPERAFVCTCEDLFEGDALERLCAFLGIDYIPGDRRARVHQSISADMRPDQKARAVEFLRPQYEFVADRIGRLPPAWEANMAGV